MSTKQYDIIDVPLIAERGPVVHQPAALLDCGATAIGSLNLTLDRWASAISTVSRGCSVQSPAQSLNVDRNPWTVTSATRPYTTRNIAIASIALPSKPGNTKTWSASSPSRWQRRSYIHLGSQSCPSLPNGSGYLPSFDGRDGIAVRALPTRFSTQDSRPAP